MSNWELEFLPTLLYTKILSNVTYISQAIHMLAFFN